MKHIIFDIETNGLLDSLDKVHCLVLRDLESDAVVSCANEKGYKPIMNGLALLDQAEIIFGHNIIKFDLPALFKVYGWKPKSRVFDTLVACRLRWNHIAETDYALNRKGSLPGHMIGRHSLEAWGYRMGILKGKYGETTDWLFWTQEMQEYCERDTLVTREIILRLKKAGYSRQAMDCEHELAYFLRDMEAHGWPFDVEKAEQLAATLAAKREVAAQSCREVFGQLLVRDGKPFTPKRDNKKLGYVKEAEVQKLKLVDFNPGSRDMIAAELIRRHKWKPEKFTEGGKPKVDEGTLKGLPYPEVPALLDYLVLDKRLGQLSEGKEAWLKLARVSPVTGLHHIHGSINSGGTVTHRASHSHPNVAQTPKVGKSWGVEMRSLYIVPPGWRLLGADESGLELRCLAHYMARYDDGAYVRVILEGKNEDGTDIHSVNMRALGFEGKLGRDKAKTWFYAYLYGAGDEKLGRIADPTLGPEAAKALGKTLRKRFEGGLVALGMLSGAIKRKVAKEGFLQLIDGRRAYVRSEHAALNTLLQGTGAVLCKHWLVHFARKMTEAFGPMGWTKQWSACGWIHDEIQIAVRPEIAEQAARFAVEAAEYGTTLFNFRCPLTGEAKLGGDWASTH